MCKRAISLLAVVVLLFVACAKKDTNIGMGKNVSFEFASNPTTGYDWQYECLEGEDKGELELVSNDYTSEAKDGMVGVGGFRKFVFKGMKAGNQCITFTYRRPWEGGEVAYDVVYELNIDSKMNITCKSKMKGSIDSEKDLAFFPDPTFE